MKKSINFSPNLLLIGAGVFTLLLTVWLLHHTLTFQVSDNNPQLDNRSTPTSADPSLLTPTQLLVEELVALQMPMPAISQIGRNLFSNTPTNFAASPPLAIKETPLIKLLSISPDTVYAQMGNIKFIVQGEKLKPGMKVYINGSTEGVVTSWTSANQLQAVVTAQHLTPVGVLYVEVKQLGEEKKLFSNPLPINVIAPPVPSFTFIGHIKEEGDEVRIILSDDKNRISAKVGDIIERWQILNLIDDYLELEDRELGIHHYLRRGQTLAKPPEVKNEETANTIASSEDTNGITSTVKPGEKSPNFFIRREKPLTYKELLQKRAETLGNKKK
jgi:hypothetical protein